MYTTPIILLQCALDVLGFSVMFFIIFIAFAELGYLLFGTQVESFSTFGTSMFTLLRTILGDFDYMEIERANRILAPIFFLSYIFLVFFILLVQSLLAVYVVVILPLFRTCSWRSLMTHMQM